MTLLPNERLNILIEARNLIREERNWCTKAISTASNGVPVLITSDMAVKFDAVGAIRRTFFKKGLPYMGKDVAGVIAEIERFLPSNTPLARFNDELEHWQVIELFERAIVLLDLISRTNEKAA